MIWLLSNVWWLVPVAVALLALSHPAALAILKRVPARVWAALAAVALLGLSFQAGRWYERSQHRDAQATAQAKSLAKGQKAAQKAQEAATAVKIEVRQESENEAVQAREIVRYLPRTCPTQPDELRVIGRDAVEAARASVPATPRRADP